MTLNIHRARSTPILEPAQAKPARPAGYAEMGPNGVPASLEGEGMA